MYEATMEYATGGLKNANKYAKKVGIAQQTFKKYAQKMAEEILTGQYGDMDKAYEALNNNNQQDM